MIKKKVFSSHLSRHLWYTHGCWIQIWVTSDLRIDFRCRWHILYCSSSFFASVSSGHRSETEAGNQVTHISSLLHVCSGKCGWTTILYPWFVERRNLVGSWGTQPVSWNLPGENHPVSQTLLQGREMREKWSQLTNQNIYEVNNQYNFYTEERTANSLKR